MVTRVAPVHYIWVMRTTRIRMGEFSLSTLCQNQFDIFLETFGFKVGDLLCLIVSVEEKGDR